MKEKSYMSSSDILEWIKVAILAGEAREAAKRTRSTAKTAKEKEWAKRMQTCATHMGKVTDERLDCLSNDQKISIKRRWEHSAVRLYTSDQIRFEEKTNDKGEPVTISHEDWCLLGELALCHCNMCPQREFVKDCEYRKMFHRVGIPVGREDVKDGECEFCVDNYIHFILPQSHGREWMNEFLVKAVEEVSKDVETSRKAKENVDNDKREFL